MAPNPYTPIPSLTAHGSPPRCWTVPTLRSHRRRSPRHRNQRYLRRCRRLHATVWIGPEPQRNSSQSTQVLDSCPRPRSRTPRPLNWHPEVSEVSPVPASLACPSRSGRRRPRRQVRLRQSQLPPRPRRRPRPAAVRGESNGGRGRGGGGAGLVSEVAPSPAAPSPRNVRISASSTDSRASTSSSRPPRDELFPVLAGSSFDIALVCFQLVYRSTPVPFMRPGQRRPCKGHTSRIGRTRASSADSASQRLERRDCFNDAGPPSTGTAARLPRGDVPVAL